MTQHPSPGIAGVLDFEFGQCVRYRIVVDHVQLVPVIVVPTLVNLPLTAVLSELTEVTAAVAINAIIRGYSTMVAPSSFVTRAVMNFVTCLDPLFAIGNVLSTHITAATDCPDFATVRSTSTVVKS